MKEMKDFLLEIGTEEIPARFMESALAQLRDLAKAYLTEKRVACQEISSYGTPRRLVLFVKGMASTQQELVEEVKGPAKKAAFTPDGQPTKAAEGFARGQGVAVQDLIVKNIEAGEYIFAYKKESGGETSRILPEFCHKLIFGLNFPKPQRWGSKEMRFARPIRWLVALYGAEVIPFEVEGLASGCHSVGHRFLSKGTIEINDPVDYFAKMTEHYVMVKQEERKRVIWEQIQTLATQQGGLVNPDESLLEEVTYLLEWPTALCGNIEEKFLRLPKEVIITPMREHQRYFPVVDAQGKLLPKFITVRNGLAQHLDIVAAGNEKVLRARLADAEFFYEEDLKTPLVENVEKLKKIVYHESLGTIYDKVERIQNLSGYLAEGLKVGEAVKKQTLRAAYLSKADLVTNMVYEFPELQGIMGQEYALKSSEESSVAQGVIEHYLPRFSGDKLPESMVGTIVSIAEKTDSIVGCFAVGIQPTGSQDPYALRRQALGISLIILEKELSISLKELINRAYAGYEGKIKAKLSQEQVQIEVLEFFKQRLKNIFTDRGLSYDVIEAILTAGFDDMSATWKRAKALADLREEQEFSKLLTAFNRAGNLAKKAEGVQINLAFLQEDVEQNLYRDYTAAKVQVSQLLAEEDFAGAMKAVAALQEPIDRFFEGVMVMADDEQVRNNRLALLKEITELMLPIADLSKIVG